MKRLTRRLINVLSGASMALNDHYRVYRKVQGAAHPVLSQVYKNLDRKIMADDREIPVRVFHPRNHEICKALIFFHGGGWVTGDIDYYTKACINMANATKHVVISVNYRLAPEHPFPAGLEDCYHVAKEIFIDPYLLRCRKADITLIGDSAGANLAAAVSLMARDRGEFLPNRQILLYPSVYPEHGDKSPFESVKENGTGYILTSERLEDYMDMYVPDRKDRYSPYVSPLLADDLSNQPKTLVITAQYDPLRDEGEAYGEKLKEFGNYARTFCINDSLHGFLTLPMNSKSVQKCYELINSFLADE